eukprot:gene18764-biopygen5442
MSCLRRQPEERPNTWTLLEHAFLTADDALYSVFWGMVFTHYCYFRWGYRPSPRHARAMP